MHTNETKRNEKKSKSPLRRKKATPRKGRRLKADERKIQIIEAAQKVFIQSGLSGARTRELADAAGVNEAIIFKYYPNKEALFDAAIMNPLQQLVEEEMEIARNYRLAATPHDELRLTMQADHRLFQRLSEVYPLLMTALFSDRRRGFEFYQKYMYPWLKALTKAQRPAFKGRRRKDIPPEIVAMIGLGAYMMITMDGYFRKKKVDVDKAIGHVSDIFNSGVFE